MKLLAILSLICCMDFIHIEYPKSVYYEIDSFIEEKKNEFLLEYYIGNQLYITFEEFFSSYESYLCYIMYDFQGAHPLTSLKTFNYLNSSYIDLEIVFNEKDYLYFSKEAQRVLIDELKKEEMFIEEMFYSGIAPVQENYQNIIIADDYYLIFFEHYQIAPYGAGIKFLKVKK